MGAAAKRGKGACDSPHKRPSAGPANEPQQLARPCPAPANRAARLLPLVVGAEARDARLDAGREPLQRGRVHNGVAFYIRRPTAFAVARSRREPWQPLGQVHDDAAPMVRRSSTHPLCSTNLRSP